MSVGSNFLRCSSVRPRIRIANAWLVTSSGEVSSSRRYSGKLTSTTISTSTPIARAVSIGRFSTRPPSTSSRPSRCAGANTPGADMLARIAVTRSPESITTGWPVSRSVAMARNGIGSWSKRCTSATGSAALRSTCSSVCPCTRPGGSTSPLSFFTPSAKRTRKLRSSCLRRKPRSSRGGRSRKASCQFSERINVSISAPDMPEAYKPPTTAPMLVPAIASTGTCISSSTFSTPTCAAPRAPPPLSTNPTRGRSPSAACAAWASRSRQTGTT